MKILQCGPSLFHVDLELDSSVSRGRATADAVHSLLRTWPDARVTSAGGTLFVDGGPSALELRNTLKEQKAPAVSSDKGRHHRIQVRYDGEDLAYVASQTGLTPQQVIGRHAGAHYAVELLGFMPGFAYLTGLDEKLVLPRRASPRARVPARSVAIAGAMTGIYPNASSGGWHLLGHAVDVLPFEPHRDPPCLFSPGDRVDFIPTSQADTPALTHPPLPTTTRPVVRVEKALGCNTVQDLGRPHLLSLGIAASGAVDPFTQQAANVSVGNSASAATLEVFHGALTLVALENCVLSVNGGPPRKLRADDALTIHPSDGALHYVAVAGGWDAPLIMGSRSTLLSAQLGRLVKKGDLLGVDGKEGAPGTLMGPLAPGPLRVWRGPHASRFGDGAWESLLKQPWKLSTALDRVGTRLVGKPLARTGLDTALPEPMVRGAIQVTPDGTPIVLGADAPATGGYPILGVVDLAGVARLGHLRPGETVTFTSV